MKKDFINLLSGRIYELQRFVRNPQNVHTIDADIQYKVEQSTKLLALNLLLFNELCGYADNGILAHAH